MDHYGYLPMERTTHYGPLWTPLWTHYGPHYGPHNDPNTMVMGMAISLLAYRGITTTTMVVMVITVMRS